MDGRRWGAARPTGKPRASPPPALRHLGLSAARCRPRPLSWWGALGTWSPRGHGAPPCPHGLHPPEHARALQTPVWLQRAPHPPLSPGRTNPEGPTSPQSGALCRPGLAPRRLGHVGSAPSLRPWSSRRPSSAAAWSHHTWPRPPPGQRSRAEPHPGPATAPARGGRTEAVAPFWTFPFSAERGRRGEEGPGGSTSPHLPRAGSTLVTH